MTGKKYCEQLRTLKSMAINAKSVVTQTIFSIIDDLVILMPELVAVGMTKAAARKILLSGRVIKNVGESSAKGALKSTASGILKGVGIGLSIVVEIGLLAWDIFHLWQNYKEGRFSYKKFRNKIIVRLVAGGLVILVSIAAIVLTPFGVAPLLVTICGVLATIIAGVLPQGIAYLVGRFQNKAIKAKAAEE